MKTTLNVIAILAVLAVSPGALSARNAGLGGETDGRRPTRRQQPDRRLEGQRLTR